MTKTVSSPGTSGSPNELAEKVSVPPGLLAVGVASYCVVMGVGLLSPALPLFVQHWDLSTTEASLLLSAFAAGRIPISMPAGRAMDRFGFVPVAYTGIAVAASSAALGVIAGSYMVMLLALFLQGLGAGMFTTGSNAAVIVISDRDTVGRFNSVYQGVILGGLVFTPVLGGLAVRFGGVRGPFTLYLVALALGALVLRVAGPSIEGTTHSGNRESTERSVSLSLLSEPAFQIMLLASVVVFAALAGIRNALLPLYASYAAGMNEIEIGWMLMASAAANVAILYPAGKTVDDRGRRPVLVVGVVAMGASVAFIAGVDTLVWLIITSAMVGMSKGIAAAPLPPFVADVAPRGMQAEAVGYYRIAVSIGLLLGPAVLGGIVDGFGFQAAFLGAGAFLAGTGALLLRMPETGPASSRISA